MSFPLLDYFNRAAHWYDDIEPAFAPLARELVSFAKPDAGDRVLDLGTGSGLAARQCASLGCAVFAFDFSWAMLNAARKHDVMDLFQSDMHNLAIVSGVFDVVLASFALNSTNPARSLSEVWRVLAPGGRIVLQEWGALDPLSELVSDTIAGYAVAEPSSELAVMRAAVETPVPWDDIDGPDDVVMLAEEAGFRDVEMTLVQSSVSLPDVETFLRYKLAWPDRRAEIDAMPVETRRLCLSDLRENLTAHAEADGCLLWRPQIFRICAYK